jgi:hypothetical protein
MKNILILIIISFFFINCNYKKEKKIKKELIDRPNKEWKELVCERGGFKIQFPDFPLKKGINTFFDDENQEFNVHFHSLNIQDSISLNMAYGISTQLWSNIDTKEQFEKMFNYQKEVHLSTLNARIEQVKILKNESYMGCEMIMTIDSSNIRVTHRIYSNEGILYHLKVLTNMNKGKLFNKATAKFMDSFEFNK